MPPFSPGFAMFFNPLEPECCQFRPHLLIKQYIETKIPAREFHFVMYLCLICPLKISNFDIPNSLKVLQFRLTHHSAFQFQSYISIGSCGAGASCYSSIYFYVTDPLLYQSTKYKLIHQDTPVTVLGFIINTHGTDFHVHQDLSSLLVTSAANSSSSTRLSTIIVQNHSKEHSNFTSVKNNKTKKTRYKLHRGRPKSADLINRFWPPTIISTLLSHDHHYNINKYKISNYNFTIELSTESSIISIISIYIKAHQL